MSDQFKREERYQVIKLKTGKQVECVVVESDWPEYEIVWKMIQDRVEGRSNEITSLRTQLTETQRLLDEANGKVGELTERLHSFYSSTDHGITMQDRHFRVEDDCTIWDENFDHDAGLRITGDFGEGDKLKYIRMICGVLNSHVDLTASLTSERSKVNRLVKFVRRISGFYESKPDYWNVCGQCEHAKDDAEALLTELGELL